MHFLNILMQFLNILMQFLNILMQFLNILKHNHVIVLLLNQNYFYFLRYFKELTSSEIKSES